MNVQQEKMDENIYVKQENFAEENNANPQYDKIIIKEEVIDGENTVCFTAVKVEEFKEYKSSNIYEIEAINGPNLTCIKDGDLEEPNQQVVMNSCLCPEMCHLCEINISNEEHETHKNLHRDGIFCICPMCDYGYTDCTARIYNHIDRKHRETHPLECIYCDRKFLKWMLLTQHISDVHPKEVSNVCLYCAYQAGSYVYLVHHILQTHSDNYLIHKCKDCTFATLNPNLFEEHVHGKHILHRCSSCRFTTRKEDELKRHNKKFHKTKDNRIRRVKKQWPSSTCPHCDYATKYRKNFVVHVKSKHNGEFTVKCNLCDFECFNSDKLKEHFSTHS